METSLESWTQEDFTTMKNCSIETCLNILKDFIRFNENRMNFPQLGFDNKHLFCEAIFHRLTSPLSTPPLIWALLHALRIISRERSDLEAILSHHHIKILLRVSKLNYNDAYENCGDSEILEALKVIFNINFQSSLIRAKFVTNQFPEYLIRAVEKFPDAPQPDEYKYFIMRILFIMTALDRNAGVEIREKLNGIPVILNYLEILTTKHEPFSNETSDLISEILKVMFNLLIPNKQLDEDKYPGYYKQMASLAKSLLFHPVQTVEKKNSILTHSIDLFSIIPINAIKDLIIRVEGSNFSYEDYDMEFIEEMVKYLYNRLERKPGDVEVITEKLSPVLFVLFRIARTIRVARKYLKRRVLPPLTKADVQQRPDVGTTLRNKLCTLMHSCTGQVTELVCDLLFVLCKENAQRFVKYTGFGNAVGHLANRGLLGEKDLRSPGTYSSDSDSDTEEYKQIAHLVSGFGWIEPERPPPCAGMTEDQKIAEAMKLVDAIDKLNRNQLIQPVRIGSDGRPHPVEHVCQLLEQTDNLIHSSNQHNHNDSSDSD